LSSFVDRPRYDCALGGALALLRAIPRAIPVVHASTGCSYNYYMGGNSGAAYLGGGYCGATTIPSSNVSEREVVFGGESRLEEQIRNTIDVIDGDLYVTISGCQVEMIGDDIRSVVDKLALPNVLAVPTPSFKGNSNVGYDLLLEALVRNYVPKAGKGGGPSPDRTKKVNVFGLIPGNDLFYKGNLREIKRLLSLIGVEANTFIGEGETLADIKRAGKAVLNVILGDAYGLLTEKAFVEVHDIPSVREQFPVGFLQAERFLYHVGAALGIAPQLIKKALEREAEVYFDYMERFADSYNDIGMQRVAVVCADANYGPALSEFFSDELGWIPHLTMITDPVGKEEKNAVLRRFEGWQSGLKPQVYFDVNASALRRFLSDSWDRNRNQFLYEPLGQVVLFGTSFEKDFAEDSGYALLTVGFPTTNRVVFDRAYAGIRGGLTLAEDTFSLAVSGR
jgi:nitrogenase molybdenum-iron protein beta chain